MHSEKSKITQAVIANKDGQDAGTILVVYYLRIPDGYITCLNESIVAFCSEPKANNWKLNRIVKRAVT